MNCYRLYGLTMEFSFMFSFHPWTPTGEKGRAQIHRRTPNAEALHYFNDVQHVLF